MTGSRPHPPLCGLGRPLGPVEAIVSWPHNTLTASFNWKGLRSLRGECGFDSLSRHNFDRIAATC